MKFDVTALKGGYGKHMVIHDVSFSVEKGQMTYVLGANGCGKTTLFKIIIGYKERMAGQISVDGCDISKLTKREMAGIVAYIPQQHVPAFNYSVKDVVVMGRAAHLPPFGVPGKADFDLVDQSLNILGIEGLADIEYTRISGGQQQLVLIARAICQQAKMIVMDEPLQSLDFVNQDMVTRTLRKLVRKGYSIIISTHTAIHNYDKQDKALLMNKTGGAAFGDIEEILTKEAIARAYGMPIETMMGEDGSGGKHLLCVPIHE